MAEHLPTEGLWKVRRWSMDQNTKESSGSIYAEPRPGHAYAVAMCPRYQKEDQWNADAAFIVKACNAYEESEAKIEALVEAVQQAIKFLEATSYTPGQEAGVLWDLKEALALTSAQRGTTT